MQLSVNVYANSGSDAAQDKITEFENTLYSDTLKPSDSWFSPRKIADQYQLVIDKWLVMKYLHRTENS